MKNLKSKLSHVIAAGSLALAALLPLEALAADEVLREHRAIWMSPSLGNNWPSAAVTNGNKASLLATLKKRVNQFKQQGVNVLYYHARVNCDATYNSSFEPWNSNVAGSRGTAAPAFDPFAEIVREAHEAGIEVYAWLNPYRYSHGKLYGDGERNYENSNPEWLLKTPSQIILNPALEEVKTRLTDIVTEIVTNYDVDGVIFDDYFYINDNSAYDADSYNAYTAAGGKLALKDWRRENVNDMVRRVQSTIKALKPYCVFGISPAGTVSPTDVGSYGLLPGPYGDWQYDGIASDPLKWLSNGWVDFLSPQVYWADRFDNLTDWFAVAVPHFNRHLYTSITLQNIAKNKVAQTIHEVDYQRDALRPNQSGVAIFEYGSYVNTYEKYEGKNRTFGEIMQMTTFNQKVLSPLRHWNNIIAPAMVSDVRTEGSTLRWNAPAGARNLRYTVYVVPAEADVAAFAQQRDYLSGVSYTDTYDISDAPAGARFAVAVYDRYGNEYSPIFQGASATQGSPATLVSPVGTSAPDLFDFTWTSPVPGRYLIELAADEAFTEIIDINETTATSFASTNLADLEEGKTYYWRVRTYAPNRTEAISAPASFNASRIAITAPAANATDVAVEPVFTWTRSAEGTEYTLEISNTENFAVVHYSATTSDATHAVPQRKLVSGRKYFARVTARKGSASSVSPTVAFNTVDRDDYAAPVFTNPTADGQTLYSNSTIAVQPYDGLSGVNIQISSTDAFPSRSIYTTTLSDFETETATLDRVKLSSKALVDGNTYYLRARGSYYLSTASAVQYTPFTPVYTFVYSSETGITDVAVAQTASYVDTENVLHIAAADPASVEIFNIAGALVSRIGNPSACISLDNIPAGSYIIHINAPVPETLKWVR